MKVTLLKFPGIWDWGECRRRVLVTVRDKKSLITLPARDLVPNSGWKKSILKEGRSQICNLWYSYMALDVPSMVAINLSKHVYIQPWVGALRTDRQTDPSGTLVNMILDVNCAELMDIANTWLCDGAEPKTKDVVEEMCRLAQEATPELEGLLVPAE